MMRLYFKILLFNAASCLSRFDSAFCQSLSGFGAYAVALRDTIEFVGTRDHLFCIVETVVDLLSQGRSTVC
jgi:hypothetical protein